MKKEEFPTFLNQKPAIIFGRTGRELLILAIGLALGYLSWLDISPSLTGSQILTDAIKIIIAAILVAAAAVVAFIKIATRPLEEWALAWIFYSIIPKVFIYMPAEESSILPETQGEGKEREKVRMSNDDDDDDDDE
ncbi:PrgI family mobile element protein [Dictyobacter aurantiacus]|uniref:Uncharacterized protein n=1 Tax=Dictyobacter aurantiacus TaxID=1936993 RepID=A0A401Z9J4_9CHLR|nr:PrgI family protein [Dictyobacter aurantiacus]GCE03478.1 hypothetical protein KDAU_08070 [Dictyobacter aurantiacus]